jgi:hypothetical protein
MTEYARGRQQVVFNLLEVGMADAASFDAHQQLAVPDSGGGDLFD